MAITSLSQTDMNTNELAHAQVKLLEMLSSRICHDLISPVGAIHNGLEFLEDMGADALEDALDLMKHSTKQATVKLQTYRMAYGAGGAESSLTYKNICETIAPYFALDNKITLDWEDGKINQDDQPKGMGKVLIGVFLLMGETLPKHGTISVTEDGETLIFKSQGDDCKFRDGTKEALANITALENVDPRLVHPYVLGLSASYYGYDINIESGENQSTLTLTKV